MDEETLDGIRYLIDGVLDDVQTYLFDTKEWHEKIQLVDNIDEAIKELESLKEILKDG